MLMADPGKMIRSDRTKVTTPRHHPGKLKSHKSIRDAEDRSNDHPSLPHVLRFQLVLHMASVRSSLL